MPSPEWSSAAAMVAHGRKRRSSTASEWNFGWDTCGWAIPTSWEMFQREGMIPKNVLMLAEPIAQQMVAGQGPRAGRALRH